MVKQLTDEQKNKIKDLLHQGVESKAVAEYIGVSSRQVAAIAAHITMGSYPKKQTSENNSISKKIKPRKSKILSTLEKKQFSKSKKFKSGILLGKNIETGEKEFWNPFPKSGAINPHALIVGESGTDSA